MKIVIMIRKILLASKALKEFMYNKTKEVKPVIKNIPTSNDEVIED